MQVGCIANHPARSLANIIPGERVVEPVLLGDDQLFGVHRELGDAKEAGGVLVCGLRRALFRGRAEDGQVGETDEQLATIEAIGQQMSSNTVKSLTITPVQMKSRAQR